MIRLGATVRMTEEGVRRWGDQARGERGRVLDNRWSSADFYYTVVWKGGYSDRYRKCDIEEVFTANSGCPCGICQGTV